MDFSIDKIDHIQVAAPSNSEQAAISFYNGILGMNQVEKPDALKGRGGVWFEFASYQLHVGVEEPFSAAKKAHPAFQVTGFEQLQKHLSASGIEVKNDDSIPGVLRFFIADPFGNRLEFLKSGL
ncbi:VOC family protein [Planomicrobium sp. CPCC 101110]|uniref:VOC family protein n=1 Tax=Planomicrobium sp. CPCC 101110 TaxID=2599619 RepID=UPI0011B57F78|nr:VOC family protein [Planomicrobium sp. CPCC 101110]TWT27517.1 glyoxalase [Planomicrobium sp. CPCC 101110]